MSDRRRTALVGLVVPSLAHGGGVPSVARFLKGVILRSERFDLRAVSLAMDSRDENHLRISRPAQWASGVRVSEGTWESVPFIHVGAIFGELEFQRYCRRHALAKALAGTDLIQVVAGSAAWANAVIDLGKPVSLQVATRARIERRRRDAHPRDLPGLWRKCMTEITDRLDDRALRCVDAIQVENPWMLDYARSINAGRYVDIRYAPPGVDDALFCPSAVRDLTSDPYVLCVARLDDPRKSIGLLLEAYALLPEGARRGTRLVLAGSSGPPAAFWNRADALGLCDRIEYVARPTRDALVRLYQRASAFALPSDEEGLGVVLLEAMACGVPVVSTRSGGPDGIITDGEDGFLVPLNDAGQMADRLARLLQDQDLNASAGRAARRTVETRYSETVAGAAFVDVWDRLLSKTGKS